MTLFKKNIYEILFGNTIHNPANNARTFVVGTEIYDTKT